MKLTQYLSRENLTIPNMLSLLRIFLIPVILLLFYYGDSHTVNYLAIPLTILAMATDFFDGYLARKLNQETELGKMLDPIADKFAIALIAIFLYFRDGFPMWLILAILLRDALILLGATLIIEKKEFVIPSNIYGKLTTAIIFLLFVIYLFEIEPLKFPLEILSGIFVFISFISYFRNFMRNFYRQD